MSPPRRIYSCRGLSGWPAPVRPSRLDVDQLRHGRPRLQGIIIDNSARDNFHFQARILIFWREMAHSYFNTHYLKAISGMNLYSLMVAFGKSEFALV